MLMVYMMEIVMVVMAMVVMVMVARYNMEADGERISESLHGACPTALGIK